MPANFVKKAYFKIKSAVNKTKIAYHIDCILANTDIILEETEPAERTGYFVDEPANGLLKELNFRLERLKLRLNQAKANVLDGDSKNAYALFMVSQNEFDECAYIYEKLKEATDENDPLILKLGRIFPQD